MRSRAGQWRVAGMHINDHMEVMGHFDQARRIDSGGDDDMACEILTGLFFYLAFKHLAEINVGECAIALPFSTIA